MSDAIRGISLKTYGSEPASSIMRSIGPATSAVLGVLSGATDLTALGEFSALMQQQIEAQQKMQLISMTSNIEKSKHETSMAPIRNTRVS